MKVLRIVFVMLLSTSWAQAVQPDVEALLEKSNPAAQAQIKIAVGAFLNGKQSETTLKTNWRGFQELATLKQLVNGDEQLIEQLAIYAVVQERREETQVVEALLVLELLHLKPIIPIRVLAPHLNSDNELLRGFVRDWFEIHATRGARGAPRELAAHYKDYSDYISLTLNMHEEFPTPLVEYLYEQSPEQALLVFLRIDRRGVTIAQLSAIQKNLDAVQNGQAAAPIPRPKPRDQHRDIRLAARLVNNAVWFAENGHDERLQAALPEVNERLAKLSAHDKWWVRLYVAEIMRRHPELRLDDVLRKLREDGEESVSKAAKSVKG